MNLVQTIYKAKKTTSKMKFINRLSFVFTSTVFVHFQMEYLPYRNRYFAAECWLTTLTAFFQTKRKIIDRFSAYAVLTVLSPKEERTKIRLCSNKSLQITTAAKNYMFKRAILRQKNRKKNYKKASIKENSGNEKRKRPSSNE